LSGVGISGATLREVLAVRRRRLRLARELRLAALLDLPCDVDRDHPLAIEDLRERAELHRAVLKGPISPAGTCKVFAAKT